MRRIFVALAAIAAAVSAGASAQEAAPWPSFEADGTVNVPAFKLPPSPFSSKEAQAAQVMRARMQGGSEQVMVSDVAKARAGLERMMAPSVAAMLAAYPVDIEDTRIAGVEVKIFTPKGKAYDRRRVLINVHGGAFQTCWPACAFLESAPIAALGGYKVVSVNYRMAPEAKHPAGVQDAAAVYRELIRRHRPASTGIYGCSAGGSLTAQLAAWLPANGLPQAGAAGIFGAGAVRMMAGDSAYVAAWIDGSFPPPARGAPIDMTRGYFDGTSMDDPIVSPALHADAIAKFPPTLIITGTRAMDMSPAIVTNSALIKARVPSTLIVGEGMGHCYIYQAGLPEARDAHQAIVDFFRANLK
jgi:monoterpene epsilon-lactone hydrolase